ncbi:MAG TPA: hypothetical protein VF047_06690 [Nitrososphaeraceae archaeon]
MFRRRYDNKNKKVIVENQFDMPMESESVQQISELPNTYGHRF